MPRTARGDRIFVIYNIVASFGDVFVRRPRSGVSRANDLSRITINAALSTRRDMHFDQRVFRNANRRRVLWNEEKQRISLDGNRIVMMLLSILEFSQLEFSLVPIAFLVDFQ